MVQPAEQVPVFFLRIDLPLGRGVVEFEFLHRMFDRGDFFREEVLEVGSFVAFRLAFGDAGGDARVLGEFFPMLLEVSIIAFDGL